MFNTLSSLLKYTIWVIILLSASLCSHAQETGNDRKETKPALELPDVIVYGVDTGYRQAGEKAPAAPFSTTALPGNASAPYPSVLLSRGELSLPSVRQSMPDHRTFLSSYVGPYSSWGLQAIHNRTLKKAHLRLYSDIQGTNGEYDNSGGTWGEIEGRIDCPLPDSVTAELQAGYRRWSYGLYDAGDVNGKSRQETFFITSVLHRKHTERTSSRLGFGAQCLKYTTPFHTERQEKLYQGDFSLQTRVGPVSAVSTVHWTGDRPSWESFYWLDNNQDVNYVSPFSPASDLISACFSARIPVGHHVYATLGGDVQFFSRDYEKDRTRFFPKARCLYRPAPPVAIHVSVEGGFQPYSLASLIEENPYSFPTVFSTAEEVRWKIETGVEVEMRPGIILRAAYHWTLVRDNLFWRWTVYTGLYSNYLLEEVRQHQLDISGTYKPDENLTLEAGISFLDYDIRDDFITGGNPSAEIPFHPKKRARGMAIYKLPGIIDIRGDWQWIGERTFSLSLPYESYYNPEKMEPYFLMNLILEKEINKNVTVFTGFYNLFGSEYEVWYNYPEMGINIHGGVKIVL